MIAVDHRAIADALECSIVRREECWLIGVGGAGPYFDPDEASENWVRPLWDEFLRRVDELPDTVDRSEFISPCHGRETDFTFYVGFAAPQPVAELPKGMICLRIPAHEYAVGRVQGPRSEIGLVYAELPAWVATQGCEVNREILWLEVYPNPPGDRDGPFDYRVFLPLR